MHRSSPSQARNRAGARAEALAEFLREETTGGRLLIAATVLALVWANAGEASYRSVWETRVALGPEWLHLDLSLAAWASDGLLALFFFVAGLEVKRELVVGELADRRAAGLPFFAAFGGMLVPATVALAASGGGAADGGAWAIPVATDIAFALGVLALVGSSLPPGVRVLLLSMAVMDDLGAIALIAVVFTHGLSLGWLAGGLSAAGAYWLAHRRRIDPAWLLWLLAIASWVCIHASGVHATIAGVLLGLLTPVRPRAGEDASVGERLEHRLHPVSAGFVVPVFALAAAGIPLGAIGETIGDPVAHGVIAGLLVGKPLGILGGAWLSVRVGVGALPGRVGWGDVVPVAVLGGIGYTVSLLIAGLAFDDPASEERAATAVLLASTAAALIAAALLRLRSLSAGR